MDNNKIIPVVSRAMEQAKKNIGEKAITEGIVFKGGKSPSGKQECQKPALLSAFSQDTRQTPSVRLPA